LGYGTLVLCGFCNCLFTRNWMMSCKKSLYELLEVKG
jgi:hypothetical protein